MIKSNSILAFLMLTTAIVGRSQDQLERDIRKLHYTVDGFIQKTDDYFKERKSEAILMILEMDSTGAVKDIHLLVDNKNIDSSYVRLQKMKPSNFEGIKFVSWKNQILNLPIYSLSGKERDTTKTYSSSYVEKSIVHIPSTIQSRKSVMVRPLYYMTMGPPIEEERPARFKIISDTKKQN